MQEYEYRMFSLGPQVGGESGRSAAEYLEQFVGENAIGGWEFYRVDSFTVVQEGKPRGCLNQITGGFLGQGEEPDIHISTYVATFRRLKE